MIKRNGAHVEARLRDRSLYNPELDLALLTNNDAVAGYALFVSRADTGRWSGPTSAAGFRTHQHVEVYRRTTDRTRK